MKELDDLDEFDRSVLFACCDANNYSLSSHVPIEAIIRRIKGINSKIIKKVIKMLVSNGFILKHPTRNQMTYQLSKKGLNNGNKIKNKVK